MASENDKLLLDSGVSNNINLYQGSAGSEVFEEAIGAIDKLGKPQEVEGNVKVDGEHELETFEEAEGLPMNDQIHSNGEVAVGSESKEVVCVSDPVIEESNVTRIQPIESNQLEGDASQASVVEDAEKEMLDNGQVNSNVERESAHEMEKYLDEIELKKKANEDHMPENLEVIGSPKADQSHDDGTTVAEKEIVPDEVNEVHNEISYEENVFGEEIIRDDKNGVYNEIINEEKVVEEEIVCDDKNGVHGEPVNEEKVVEEKIVHDDENGVHIEIGNKEKVVEQEIVGDDENAVRGELSIEEKVVEVAPSLNELNVDTGALEEGREGLIKKFEDVGLLSLIKDVAEVDSCENGHAGEGNSGGVSVGVHQISENGNAGESEFHTIIDKQPVDVLVDEVQSCKLRERVEHQNEKPELECFSGKMDAYVDAEIKAAQEERHVPRVLTESNGKCAVETDDIKLQDNLNSPSQLSSVDKNIGSSINSEVPGKTQESRATEDTNEVDAGKKSISLRRLASSESLRRDFVSVEEYDESSSSDGDNQQESTEPRSSATSTDPPLPSRRPAGLGSSVSLLEPAPRVQQQPRVNGTHPQRQSPLVEEPGNAETEEYDETREKLQMIRVKFLRLAHRLGQTPHNVVVAQVLYRLGLAEQLRGSRNISRAGAFSFDRASAMAVQLETTAGQEALDFSCTIMVIGKTGVGKSATINSIFDDVKFSTDAFVASTKKVQDIVGMVQGIKIRVIDTPGLHSSCLDQRQNKKILNSVKNFIKKTPPDIVLYLDRLDMQSRDFGDVPLLRTITDTFGPSIWFNAIVVLTHAASAPPDGPNGTLSYEMFVTQRSHVVQQAIRQAAGDMRLMNPVSLVENHSACRTNRAGQRVLPNGQVWKPHLLLLSFASKILAEANTLLKLQESPPGKPFGTRSKVPPLPFLLSSLLQSRPQLKLPEEQYGEDEDTMDDDLDETSDSDSEPEYDELPPFKRLTMAQLGKLSREQKRAYFEELDYREKLFMRKQLKEEKRRRKLLKKMAQSANASLNDNENEEEESGSSASVPVPVPDMPLPSSFDSDNPTHRYRYLDNSNQWLIRPVLDTHGWDHDVGYEGVNVERMFVVKEKIPVSLSGQVTKDKKESNLQMEVASSIKYGVGKATCFGFDMQTMGKDMAYTLRSELRFNNFRYNKTAAGLSVNILGDAVSAGMKLEDILMVGKRLKVVMTGGAMTNRGDVAYGGTLEATLRDKDHPLGRMLSTLGLSVMDWHGDLAIGGNFQSQIPVGRTTNMIARVNLNNKGAGQVSIRFNSSEQLQIALLALVPVIRNLLKNRLFGSSQSM